jgi:hypothetical protein
MNILLFLRRFYCVILKDTHLSLIFKRFVYDRCGRFQEIPEGSRPSHGYCLPGTWDREELVERSLTTLLVILLHVHLQRTYGPLIAFEHSYCMFGIGVLL